MVRILTIVLLALGIAAGTAAHPTFAATNTVSTCSASGTGSLPQVVSAAAAGDTIIFSVDCPTTSPIKLGSTIDVTKNLTIDGSGHQVAIDGGNSIQLFSVSSGVTFSLSNLTLQNGKTGSHGEGGAIFNDGTLSITASTFANNSASYGGAIDNPGTVSITASTFTGNSAIYGGAIYSPGKVTLTDTSLSGNSAAEQTAGVGGIGGAVFSFGTLTVIGSTFTNNSAPAPDFGGAIFNNGTLAITGSTFSGNSAGGGSAIDNPGTVSITASTFSGNSDAMSGAIFNTGTLTITASTLAGNSATMSGGAIENAYVVSLTASTLANNAAPYGGAIFNEFGGTVNLTANTLSGNSSEGNPSGGGAIDNQGTVNVGGNIIANSISGGNCYNDTTDSAGATIADEGYNLEDDAGASCGFSTGKNDIVGKNPQLGSLADNGGPTQTMALAPTSPAIDVIPTTDSALCPASGTDQRGDARPDAGESVCDIGAYESSYLPAPTVSLSSSANPSVFGQAVTFTAAVSLPQGGSTPTGTVQFAIDGTAVGSPVTLNGSGEAAYTTSSLAVTNGTNHTVSAAYTSNSSSIANGNGALAGGQEVDKASTTTTVTSSSNPSVYGQAVTFTATVAAKGPGAGTPTGSVQFAVDGSNVGSPVTLDANDQASYTASGLGAGPYTVTASYGGDGNFLTSPSSPLSQTVNRAPQTITFAALPDRVLGAPPFTVSATGGGSGNPVTFSIDPSASAVCTAGGTNDATITLTGAGTCTVIASQAGNQNYQDATPVAQSFTVNPLELELSVSPTTATTGQTVTAGYTLANHTSVPMTVSGTVTFAYAGSGGSLSIPVPFTLTLDPGQTLSRQVTFTIRWWLPRGTYTVTVKATDSDGTTTSSASLTVI